MNPYHSQIKRLNGEVESHIARMEWVALVVEQSSNLTLSLNILSRVGEVIFRFLPLDYISFFATPIL